jgi:hypothetical protein
MLSAGSPAILSAQTPTAPAAPSSGETRDPQQQPGQQPTEQPPAQPGQLEQQPQPLLPMQQYQIQQPGRPSVTPGTPPSTTIPPWTPPVPPAPSQTNIPAPFPFATPGAPGALPAVPGFVGVSPGIASAFAPTVANIRGGTLEFHPTLRLGEEYSDNFFQTSTHADDNFRSTFGPGFTLLLNGARTFGTLSTSLDLVHDTAPNSGDEVKFHPNLNAALRYAFTPRLALTLTETYIRDDAPAAADPFGIRRGRETFSTNTLGVAVDWLLDQIAVQAYYRNVLFFNESGGGTNTGNTGATNEGDSITHILGINAGTRIATDYLIRLGYEISRSDNTGGSSNNTGTGTSDSTTHTGFASLSRQIGLYASGGVATSYSYQTSDSTTIWNGSLFGAYGIPNGLSVSAAVGYSLLNSDTQDNEGTISANVTGSYRFARTMISVGVLQDFEQTAQKGENFGTVKTRSYFGSFLYQVTPFINATLNAMYSENEPTGTGNSANGGTTTALTYGARVSWQILRWLSASLEYTHTKQTGQNVFNSSLSSGSGSFAENRAVLNFFATF